MSRKQYSKELKLELVKKHLEDGISYWKLGKEYGIEAIAILLNNAISLQE